MGMKIRIPRLRKRRKPRTGYFFYKVLTDPWSKNPAVLLYGMNGTTVKLWFNQDKLKAVNPDDGLEWHTHPLSDQIASEADLFSGFNNWLGDLYRAGVLQGPVNGGPVYLDRTGMWVMTSDVCRSFLESVYYAIKGTKPQFR